jgi:hypothetical protein
VLPQLLARNWQLTNTRYLLGEVGSERLLLKDLPDGSAAPLLRVAARFAIVRKPGVVPPLKVTDVMAVSDTNGPFALFEFPDALPRAKLYSHWLVNTNPTATLAQVVNASFDPAQNVVVEGGVPEPASGSPDRKSGAVEFAAYSPKDFTLKTDVRAPAVLLLNDRFDANWKVRVDGREARLLRCNYIMRGVYLNPGAQTVRFRFQPPIGALYPSLAGVGAGLLLFGYVILAARRSRTPPVPAILPASNPPAPTSRRSASRSR